MYKKIVCYLFTIVMCSIVDLQASSSEKNLIDESTESIYRVQTSLPNSSTAENLCDQQQSNTAMQNPNLSNDHIANSIYIGHSLKLLENIFTHFNVRELGKSSAVSKTFKAVVEKSLLPYISRYTKPEIIEAAKGDNLKLASQIFCNVPKIIYYKANQRRKLNLEVDEQAFFDIKAVSQFGSVKAGQFDNKVFASIATRSYNAGICTRRYGPKFLTCAGAKLNILVQAISFDGSKIFGTLTDKTWKYDALYAKAVICEPNFATGECTVKYLPVQAEQQYVGANMMTADGKILFGILHPNQKSFDEGRDKNIQNVVWKDGVQIACNQLNPVDNLLRIQALSNDANMILVKSVKRNKSMILSGKTKKNTSMIMNALSGHHDHQQNTDDAEIVAISENGLVKLKRRDPYPNIELSKYYEYYIQNSEANSVKIPLKLRHNAANPSDVVTEASRDIFALSPDGKIILLDMFRQDGKRAGLWLFNNLGQPLSPLEKILRTSIAEFTQVDLQLPLSVVFSKPMMNYWGNEITFKFSLNTVTNLDNAHIRDGKNFTSTRISKNILNASVCVVYPRCDILDAEGICYKK